MPGNRVLVTGGTGMVGAHVVPRLLAAGHPVTLLTSPDSSRAGRLRLEAVADRLDVRRVNLSDAAEVRARLEEARPEAVLHMASTRFNPPGTTPAEHVRVNVLGTLHVLEAACAVGVRRVVFTGSCAEYGDGTNIAPEATLRPTTTLGATKAAASLLVQTYGRLHDLETVVLRLFTPYGPWEAPTRLIPNAILSALEGREVRMSSGAQERDFVFVADVADVILAALDRPVPPAAALNVGAGRGVRIRDVVERTLELLGSPVPLRVGALPARPDEIWRMSADITATCAVLGWVPRTSLDEGLRLTIEWFRRNTEAARHLT